MSNEEFNWEEFHKNLDIALATMITETNALPSKTTLLEFLEYSNKKQHFEAPESERKL